MRKVIQTAQIQLIITDNGENWCIELLHAGSLLHHSQTESQLRLIGGKREQARLNTQGRPHKVK